MAPLLVALLAAALLAPASATAAGWEPEPARSHVSSDGRRMAAWLLPEQRVQVFIDGRQPVRLEHAAPADCPERELAAVGGGRVLFLCDWPQRGVVMDARTGVVSPLPSPVTEGYDDVIVETDLGARWLRLPMAVSHGGVYVKWLDLETGSWRFSDEPGRRYVEDLDSADLRRPLCRPLHRRALDDYDGAFDPTEFLDAEYRRPYLLTQLNRRSGGSWSGAFVGLQRCGDRHTVRLSQTRTIPLGFAGRWALWPELGAVHGYRDGHFRRWPLPRPRDSWTLDHTSHHLFARAASHARGRMYSRRIR